MFVQTTLIILVIAAVICILALNFYYRVKVMKAYKILVQNRVQFDSTDIFNNDKVNEAVKRHPNHETDIWNFINYIRKSMQLASVLIVLITAFAAILMFVREE